MTDSSVSEQSGFVHPEKGATLIEFALVLPILILILVGIMEIGLAFGEQMRASQATREGARIGAVAGNDPDADCFIIRDVVAVMSQPQLDRLVNLQIYETDPVTGNQNFAQTNTYTYTGGDPTDCVNSWSGVVAWPSTTRQVTTGPTAVLDLLGVRVQMDRSWVTGFPPFSGSYTIDTTTISRIEPEAFE